MSAIPRLAAVAGVTIGLAQGCGDDLGRPAYSWDAGQVTRRPDSSVDLDAPRDATADATDADSTIDATSAGDAFDAGLDASDAADAPPDSMAGLDANADVMIDAILDAQRPDAASDAGPTDSVRAALRLKSPTCSVCAETLCTGEFMGCAMVRGTADAGRDASVATRSQLCVEMLVCLMDTECESDETTSCYCGYKQRDLCWVPDIANGECKTKIERSFETTDPRGILDDLATPDRETGGGWAFLLSRCLHDNGCTSCFGRPEAGIDASTEPDVMIDVSSPPVDARPDLPPALPDVAAEAEAGAPRDATGGDSSPDTGVSDVASPPSDTHQSDANQDADASTSDAD